MSAEEKTPLTSPEETPLVHASTELSEEALDHVAGRRMAPDSGRHHPHGTMNPENQSETKDPQPTAPEASGQENELSDESLENIAGGRPPNPALLLNP